MWVGFGCMKEEGKERRKGSERKRKEAKEERKCDTGKKLDEGICSLERDSVTEMNRM